MSIREKILAFLFPETCLFCSLGNKVVCEKCFTEIPKNLQNVNDILAVYKFSDKRINKLLWQLKYHHTHGIAKVFGKVLAKELQPYLNHAKLILIPIPLSAGDKRMHNHAELIANSIKDSLPKTLLDISVTSNLLIKNSKIKQAHTKSKKQRFENIKNTFSINKKLKKFSEEDNILYIIVDDVSTTGATINEARKVLAEYLNLNENKILAITVAH